MDNLKSNNRLFKGFVTVLTLSILIGLLIINQSIDADVQTVALDHSKNYTVAKVNPDGAFSNVESYTDFGTAKARMNALNTNTLPHVVTTQVKSERVAGNYTKIIAQPSGGYAQSYPYRKGTVTNAIPRNTLEIFSNKGLTSSVGYVPGHYQMKVYDILEQGNSFIADVEISGLRGFVDINKVDLIPSAHIRNYKGEGGIPIIMGGHESFYTGDKVQNPYSMLVKPEYYEVKKNGQYNEITFYQYRTFPGMTDAITTFGISAGWMGPGIYYSDNNIHYFKDFDRKQPVLDGTSQGEYYSYFQWLPVNSMSLHNGDTLRSYLDDIGRGNSVYYNETQAFVENGNKYGMNALLIFAQANLESAYGTSKYAKDRNNLFGWNAVDSNPDNAARFDSVSDSIKLHMNQNLMEYMQPSHWKHFGYGFGNMSSGVSVKYASDPLYGMKIASIALRTDKINGFKDYNNYQFTKLPDSQSVSFTTAANTNSTLYRSKAGKNQLVSNLGTSGNFVKTNRVNSSKSNGAIDLTKDFVYFPTSGSTRIANHGPAGNALPKDLIIVGDVRKEYTLKSNQALRTEWNETSTVLTTIPKDTKLDGYLTNNGYVYFSYNGYKGYIKESLVDSGNEIVLPDRSGNYKVSSSTNLNLRKEPNTTSGVLKSIPKSSIIKVEDIGNKDWGKVTFDGQTGYVHFDFITLVKDEEIKPTLKKGDINGDGRISVTDVAIINSHLLGYTKLTEVFSSRADINGDKRISITDAAMINSHLLGIRSLD